MTLFRSELIKKFPVQWPRIVLRNDRAQRRLSRRLWNRIYKMLPEQKSATGFGITHTETRPDQFTQLGAIHFGAHQHAGSKFFELRVAELAASSLFLPKSGCATFLKAIGPHR